MNNEEFNRKMLGLFYAQSSRAGKQLVHAPYWDEHKKQREAWELQRSAHETLCSLFRGDHLKPRTNCENEGAFREQSRATFS